MLVEESVHNIKKYWYGSHISTDWFFFFSENRDSTYNTMSKLSPDFLMHSSTRWCLSARCEVAEMQNYFQ